MCGRDHCHRRHVSWSYRPVHSVGCAPVDDDILSQGGDREPSPWPRRLSVIGVLLLVVAGGVTYLALPRHPHSPSATASSAPPGLAAPALPAEPNGIGGPTLAMGGGPPAPSPGAPAASVSPAPG